MWYEEEKDICRFYSLNFSIRLPRDKPKKESLKAFGNTGMRTLFVLQSQPHHLNLLASKRWIKVGVVSVELKSVKAGSFALQMEFCLFSWPFRKIVEGEERERVQMYAKESWWIILFFLALMLNCVYSLQYPFGTRFIAFQDWNSCREQRFMKK